MSETDPFVVLKDSVAGCRICRDKPDGPALPHEPRPIVQGTSRARILVASQAPGNRAHQSGRPFQDPSGMRLRDWLGLDETAFYDPDLVAIVPMGFCFPGYDRNGGDLPPRRECAPRWQAPFLALLPRIELLLPIGLHAQIRHLGRGPGLGERMRGWRGVFAAESRPRILPLPHPSWRNTAWLRRNSWFETDLLPVLRAEVARLRSAA
ncbi:uracil-DNA glycosylase family protein [Enterovirga rhinocerotis]|uniref:uracil-DNA glycosylase family protein n=1 Tax=Enterovirga rhinocerotis TaxID=1339210 RepID=UPI001AAE03E8|nr:uracil-DNA glycosylase family protein [Enterovirga rhinocerotis]